MSIRRVDESNIVIIRNDSKRGKGNYKLVKTIAFLVLT